MWNLVNWELGFEFQKKGYHESMGRIEARIKFGSTLN